MAMAQNKLTEAEIQLDQDAKPRAYTRAVTWRSVLICLILLPINA